MRKMEEKDRKEYREMSKTFYHSSALIEEKDP
jgi:hypothetical protein